MKWIDEKVLQKYFKESFKFYNSWFVKTYGENATSVKYNVPFDKINSLKDGADWIKYSNTR